MSGIDPATLDERLRAVERAVTDADRPPADLADAAELTDRTAAAESRLEDLEARIADLEAATEALRGYVGSVRSVDREIEERSETALATARSVERRLDAAGVASDPASDDPTTAAGSSVPSSSPGDTGPSGDGNWDSPSGEPHWPEDTSGPDDPPASGRTAGDRQPPTDAEGTCSGRTENEHSPDRETPVDPDPATGEDPPATDPTPTSGRTTCPPGRDSPPVSGPERSEGPGSPGEDPAFERPAEDSGTGVGSGGDPAWPTDGTTGKTTDPSGGAGGGESWPPGDRMDVDRTEPWSIPDPPEVEETERGDADGGLLDRLRGSL